MRSSEKIVQQPDQIRKTARRWGAGKVRRLVHRAARSVKNKTRRTLGAERRVLFRAVVGGGD